MCLLTYIEFILKWINTKYVKFSLTVFHLVDINRHNPHKSCLWSWATFKSAKSSWVPEVWKTTGVDCYQVVHYSLYLPVCCWRNGWRDCFFPFTIQNISYSGHILKNSANLVKVLCGRSILLNVVWKILADSQTLSRLACI